MARQLKSTVKPPPKTKQVIVKMSPDEYATIYSNSRHWAKGNLSEFLRQAGKHWRPSDADLVDVDGADEP